MVNFGTARDGAAAALALVGCATFSTDGAFGRVNELTDERTGQTAQWQRNAADGPSTQALIRREG